MALAHFTLAENDEDKNARQENAAGVWRHRHADGHGRKCQEITGEQGPPPGGSYALIAAWRALADVRASCFRCSGALDRYVLLGATKHCNTDALSLYSQGTDVTTAVVVMHFAPYAEKHVETSWKKSIRMMWVAARSAYVLSENLAAGKYACKYSVNGAVPWKILPLKGLLSEDDGMGGRNTVLKIVPAKW